MFQCMPEFFDRSVNISQRFLEQKIPRGLAEILLEWFYLLFTVGLFLLINDLEGYICVQREDSQIRC